MTPDARGPELLDWARAWLRGLHPLRWLLCLGGLLATAGLNSPAPSPSGLAGTRLLGWWRDPVEKVAAVSADLQGATSAGILVAACVLTLTASLWSLIGGWIARHELVARHRPAPYEVVRQPERPYGSATAFLLRNWGSLLLCCPLLLGLFLFAAVQVLLAAWVSGLPGGIGALVVSLLLPLVLLAVLFLVYTALGALAWPLMPVAVAAEWGGVSDALNRGYRYSFRGRLRFVLLTAVAVALAWLPVLAVVHVFPRALGAGGEVLPSAVQFAAAALSVSLFWSLETLVYLHLRAAVDLVDAGNLAAGPTSAETDGQQQGPLGHPPLPSPTGADPVGVPQVALGLVALFAGTVGLWCLTIYLFSRVSAGPTTWLDWGLTPWSVPPTGEVPWPYWAASVVAGFIAVIALTLPLRTTIRRHRTQGGPRSVNREAAARFLRRLGETADSESEICHRLIALLGHRRFLVRLQAQGHLLSLVPEGSSIGYQAWAPARRREAAIARWRQLVAPPPASPDRTPSAQAPGTYPAPDTHAG